MKRTLTVLAASLFATSLVMAQPQGGAPAAGGGAPAAGGTPGAQGGAAPELTDQLRVNASYAIGVSIGKNLQADKEALNLEMVMQGLQDSLTGQELKLNDDQMKQVLMDFNRAMLAREQTKAMAAAQTNKQEEQQFLGTNANQPGVKATESGLQYKVLAAGQGGASPKPTDMVKAHYHGTFLDGTVFDSSVQRGEPITLPVNGVIDGWAEALQMMKPGDKWKLWIPSKLAYGDQPQPGSPIPAGKMLVFEVELLEVNPKQ
ncbi:MAG TPA: FKBP-type peptidyl-prolyl cis-trans isomerase [Pirellulaceae bacterium]|jgi:FKBP-type peptidyl-prolyl cis-trans isomerase|nr:FKBP-type peptidyl-prolyl cis-trans isomerase [Pirellulaceae bacterium]